MTKGKLKVCEIKHRASGRIATRSDCIVNYATWKPQIIPIF